MRESASNLLGVFKCKVRFDWNFDKAPAIIELCEESAFDAVVLDSEIRENEREVARNLDDRTFVISSGVKRAATVCVNLGTHASSPLV